MIYIIRHGQTEQNYRRLLTGRRGIRTAGFRSRGFTSTLSIQPAGTLYSLRGRRSITRLIAWSLYASALDRSGTLTWPEEG